MGRDKGILFVISALVVLLKASEVQMLNCYHCTNCNSTNMKKLTCSLQTTTSSTTTTTPSSTTGSSSSSTTNTSSSTNTSLPTTIPTPETTTSNSSFVPTQRSVNGDIENINKNIQVYNAETNIETEGKDFNNDHCTCENGICNCIESMMDLRKTTFVCVTDIHAVNGVNFTNKGCAVDFQNVTKTCLLSGYTSNCKICNKDHCNSGISISSSSFILISALYISYLYS